MCFSALHIKITNSVIWYASFELSLAPTSVEDLVRELEPAKGRQSIYQGDNVT